jgi:isopentenyl phosphate kinase
MFVIKLGGSVLTDKSKKYVFNHKVMDSLASEIKKANKEVILVHGAGSFGHILAKEHKLNEGYTHPDQLRGFSKTHAMVQMLNYYVLTSLQKADIAAVSLPPHALLTLDNHNPFDMDFSMFTDYLDKGFTPVTFGDVVLDKTLGFSICSGDLLVEMLSKKFSPEQVIFVFDEDGLYTSNPKRDPSAQFIEKATFDKLQQLATSANTYADVTKGMGGKIDTIRNIAKFGIDTILLNGNKEQRLYHILINKNTKHTYIFGEKQ